MFPPFPEGTKSATFGMGCFWGVERNFWKIKGVYSTHVSPKQLFNWILKTIKGSQKMNISFRYFRLATLEDILRIPLTKRLVQVQQGTLR